MRKSVAFVLPSSTVENPNDIQLLVSNDFVSHQRFYFYQINSSDQILGANCKVLDKFYKNFTYLFS